MLWDEPLSFSNPNEPLNDSPLAVPVGTLGVAFLGAFGINLIRSSFLLRCKAASIL